MKLLILLFLLSSSFLTAQETSTAEQRLEQLRQQVIETMRKEGPAKAGELVKNHLEVYTDSKALFYRAWSHFNNNEFEEAELYARPLTVTADPSVRAASYLLLGEVYSATFSEENNPVYYLTEAMLASQEHDIPKVEYQAHIALTLWYVQIEKYPLSELHLGRAKILQSEHKYDPSDYFYAEYFRFISLGAFRLAKRSALQMIEQSEVREYDPYYKINLAIAQAFLDEFEEASENLAIARKVCEARKDKARLEVIQIIEQVIKFCRGEKKTLPDDWLNQYATNSEVPYDRMMGKFIRLMIERCK
jgi:hypothetical protein